MASDEASIMEFATIRNANEAGGLHVIKGLVGVQVDDYILKLKNLGFSGFNVGTFL